MVSALSSMPIMSVSARRAARLIVKAVRQEKSQLIISAPAKLGVIAHTLFPNTVNRVMRIVAKNLPQVEGHERFTGASSQGIMEKAKWAKPLMKFNELAQKDLNQRGKHDGDYNLGVSKKNPSTVEKNLATKAEKTEIINTPSEAEMAAAMPPTKSRSPKNKNGPLKSDQIH